MSAAEKAMHMLRTRAVYFTVKRMVDPDTGELVGCFVPSHPVDARSLRERGMNVGREVRCKDIKQSRNPKFFRLAHVLGGFLADHVEGFEGLGQHDAVKKLQELSGVGCCEEAFTMDLGSLGIHAGTRRVAESLNFDEMDEGRFTELWDGGHQAGHEGGWLGWLRKEKWGLLSPEQIEDVEAMLEPPH